MILVYSAQREYRFGARSPITRIREFWSGDIGWMDFVSGVFATGWGTIEYFNPLMRNTGNFQILMWIFPHAVFWSFFIGSLGFSQIISAIYNNIFARKWLSFFMMLIALLLGCNLVFALKGITPGASAYIGYAFSNLIVMLKFTNRVYVRTQ